MFRAISGPPSVVRLPNPSHEGGKETRWPYKAHYTIAWCLSHCLPQWELKVSEYIFFSILVCVRAYLRLYTILWSYTKAIGLEIEDNDLYDFDRKLKLEMNVSTCLQYIFNKCWGENLNGWTSDNRMKTSCCFLSDCMMAPALCTFCVNERERRFCMSRVKMMWLFLTVLSLLKSAHYHMCVKILILPNFMQNQDRRQQIHDHGWLITEWFIFLFYDSVLDWYWWCFQMYAFI